MRTHVMVIGWLNIVIGALSMVGGIFAACLFAIPGFFPEMHGAFPFFGALGAFVLTLCFLAGLPSLIVGIGLVQLKPWARIAAVVLSILHLINATTYGLSTLLGVYSLVILFSAETEALFAGRPYRPQLPPGQDPPSGHFDLDGPV